MPQVDVRVNLYLLQNHHPTHDRPPALMPRQGVTQTPPRAGTLREKHAGQQSAEVPEGQGGLSPMRSGVSVVEKKGEAEA